MKNEWWLMLSNFSTDENDLQDPMYMRNKSCTFYNNMINVMTFYQDQPVLEKKIELPPGTKLVSMLIIDPRRAIYSSSTRSCLANTLFVFAKTPSQERWIFDASLKK